MVKGPDLTAWPLFELTTALKEARIAAASHKESKEAVGKHRPIL